jgi:hypothetical protein
MGVLARTVGFAVGDEGTLLSPLWGRDEGTLGAKQRKSKTGEMYLEIL